MVAGDHGHPGTVAPLPVAVASKIVSVFAIVQYPSMVAKTAWEMQKPARFATNNPVQLVSLVSLNPSDDTSLCLSLSKINYLYSFPQMDVFQIHALMEPSVQASQMALGNVENAPMDTLAMESTARISMRCSQKVKSVVLSHKNLLIRTF